MKVFGLEQLRKVKKLQEDVKILFEIYRCDMVN